jgi:hypothetical protein
MSLSENVAAGIPASRRGRHPAARKKASLGETFWICRGFIHGHADPPGWKPRLYVSQDARRYLFQTDSIVFIRKKAPMLANELLRFCLHTRA